MNFEDVYKIDVNDKTEKKNGLTYLSWSYAWKEFKGIYPDATYEIVRNDMGLPYVFDENTGYMVFTRVTANGLTHEMWLPVMDSNNKAMKNVEYKYKVLDKRTGNYIEKTVAPATMFDLNKTIMRCLTKNLAMFGLGLYIYNGEDVPEGNDEETPTTVAQPTQPTQTTITTQPTTTEKVISEAQRKLFFVKVNQKGLSEEQAKELIGKYGYSSSQEILAKDFNKILTELGV